MQLLLLLLLNQQLVGLQLLLCNLLRLNGALLKRLKYLKGGVTAMRFDSMLLRLLNDCRLKFMMLLLLRRLLLLLWLLLLLLRRPGLRLKFLLLGDNFDLFLFRR